MKKLQLIPILFAVVLSTQYLYAQDTTQTFIPKIVSVEEMVGDKRQFLQIILNKVFVEKKKIGLLSISSYTADNKDNISNNEYQNTTLIYHHLFKGISINSGASFNFLEGMKNFVGLQYMHQSKTLSILYLPNYYFVKSHKISNTVLIEYRPEINKNWSVYTRLQLLYNHNLENGNHFRSYAYSRLGLTYKYLSFGLAQNFDRYGTDKNTKNNYGIFLKLSL